MEYRTIAAPSQAKYTEKMSRFLAFAHPVETVEQARELITRYTNEYHDARHVCWAYMLGAKRLEYQSTDNGEPSGTAGKPILGQINSFELTDVVVIVVRYFGGIKLGTSGLIVAYREAAKEALSQAEIVKLEEKEVITLQFPYLEMNDVMKVVKSTTATVLEQEFDNVCRLTLNVPSSIVDLFSRWSR